LILSIVIASSLYLSWTTDRGLGDLTIERHIIEREPGRTVDFMIYSPKEPNYEGPLPLVLTTHGIAGSKEGMYSFNIELARRNFTVVSVDLPGHGDSLLSFELDDFENMALDCLAAVEFVQERENVDDSEYGVLTHSMGFQVSIALSHMANAPSTYAAVGAVADMGLGNEIEYPGNLLIALGEYDEMISTQEALEAIRTATGNESAEAGITYGSFENGTAYKLALAPTDHVFAAIDGEIVRAATTWLVRGVQGEEKLQYTRNPADQVFVYKVIAMATGVFGLLVSTIPLLAIIGPPLGGRPSGEESDEAPASTRDSLIISAIIGAVIIIIFGATSYATFILESVGLYWPNSMFATGMALFFIIATLGILLGFRLGLGKEGLRLVFKRAGLYKELPQMIEDPAKGVVVALIVIGWLVGWMALGGLPSQMEPWIVFSMVRYPVGMRFTNIIILAVLAIPFFVADTAWTKGLLFVDRNWNGKSFSKKILFSVAARLAVSAVAAGVMVVATTALGYIAGSMVLLGLLLMLFIIISAFTTIVITFSAEYIRNPWPAILISSFILAWVVISAIPLI
jgi:pimeloyl-ACP methyl ester carboxylesterase